MLGLGGIEPPFSNYRLLVLTVKLKTSAISYFPLFPLADGLKSSTLFPTKLGKDGLIPYQ